MYALSDLIAGVHGCQVFTRKNTKTIDEVWNLIARPCIESYNNRETLKQQFKCFIKEASVALPRTHIRLKNSMIDKDQRNEDNYRPRVF